MIMPTLQVQFIVIGQTTMAFITWQATFLSGLWMFIAPTLCKMQTNLDLSVVMYLILKNEIQQL